MNPESSTPYSLTLLRLACPLSDASRTAIVTEAGDHIHP